MKNRILLLLIWSVAALQLALPGLDGPVSAQTPEPPSPTDGSPAPTATDLLEGVLITRTPEPTSTPGRVDQQVEEVVEAAGLSQTSFLGLRVVQWISLGISLLYVLAAYLIGKGLARLILPAIVRRTQGQLDEGLLVATFDGLRWFLVILVLRVATNRLIFVPASVKRSLEDVYFILQLFLVARIVFKLIDLAGGWARQRMTRAGREAELDRVTVLIARMTRIVTTVVALIILLSHFGVDVTALGAALGLGGIAFTLAAQDTISDAIAGVIILVDRPFRIGDRIEIQGFDTWGDVLDIGLRSTRIRTRDNRVVILPNRTIGSNQVTNYSYPEPSYRSETHLTVGYDTDLEVTRRLIVETVRNVEGVAARRPIDSLYIEMGASGIIFRVRWWIEDYRDLRRNLDRVHTALQAAFNQAGISFAPTTQSVKLQADSETVRRVASVFKGRARTRAGEETDA